MTTKKFYLYQRNGVWYANLKCKTTGKKLTARSTGTRNKTEAEEIAYRWYYNSNDQQKAPKREVQKVQIDYTDIVDSIKTRATNGCRESNRKNYCFLKIILDKKNI